MPNAVLTVGLILWAGINLYALWSGRSRLPYRKGSLESRDPPDAILVLGAGVGEDGTPSPMLLARLVCAATLYERGLCDTLIVSGDHSGRDYDEVSVMKETLIGLGIPSDRIFMDHLGFSTYDSLYRAGEIFGAKSLVVVSQDFHLARAVMIGRHLGLELTAASAEDWAGWQTTKRILLKNEVRESLARCKDFFLCLFRPEPMYLGDPVALSGSGDGTNEWNYES